MYCMKPLITISMETKQGTKNLTRDCTTRHGTRPVCKSFRFVLFTVLEIQGSKLKKKKKKKKNNNNNNKQKNWENELFIISLLLVMQFSPYFRYTCMLHKVTILQQQN